MCSDKATISEVISGMLNEARRLGFSESSLWKSWIPMTNSVEAYYRRRGLCTYSSEITDQYLRLHEKRYKAGEISYSTIQCFRQIVRRIHEYYITGTLRTAGNTRKSHYYISPENAHLVDSFIAEHGYGENTCNDVAWAVKRYLFYFEKLGHSSLATVTVEDVRQYILKTTSEMKLNSLYDVFLYLRHFHIYLKEHNYPAPDCTALFSHKVQREKRVQGYVTDEELEKILSVIDTESEKGKRDYALILLAATTGLRACDIIRLKLENVNWRRGEIAIVQNKTGNKVYLPLLSGVGTALQDYILHARPSISAQEIFLTTMGVRGPIADAVAIGDMFKNYETKAGVARHPFDGKGFHGLRRRLAKKLLTAGTPTTTIAQILGHTDVDSTENYLSLDTENLRECALDFSIIPLMGGVFCE
jgi:site-specific recombinase XerD